MADTVLSFVPKVVHLEFYRGDDPTLRAKFAGDVTDREFAAQIRTAPAAEDTLADFDIDASYDPDAEVTYAYLSLTGAQTAALPHVAAWDFQYVLAGGGTRTIAQGNVFASGDVTRPDGGS